MRTSLYVCEAASSEVMYEATAPWSGAHLDYEIAPIVNMERAVEISAEAIAFRQG